MDPRSPCYFLCPPVSESHRGGSTDLEKGSLSKCPQEPGGKEMRKGDGEDQGPGEDQLHLSGVVEKKEALCKTYSHVYKTEKQYRQALQTCAFMYTHVYTFQNM